MNAKTKSFGRGNRDSQRAHSESTARSGLYPMVWPVCGFIFGLLIVWSMLNPLDSTSVFTGDAQAQDLGWLLLAVCVGIAGNLTAKRVTITRTESIALVATIGWMSLGTWQAGLTNNPRIGWNGFWHVVALACCFYSARILIHSDRLRTIAVLAILGGSISLAFQGIHQVTVTFPQDRAAYAEDPEGVLDRLGLVAPPGSPTRKRFEDRLQSPEPFAVFSLTNSLAVILSAGLVLSLTALLSDAVLFSRAPKSETGAQTRSPLGRVSMVLIAGLIGTTWFLTRSRTAYLAVAVAVILVSIAILWLWKRGSTHRNSAIDPARSTDRRKVRRVTLGGVAISVLLIGLGIVWLWRNDKFVLSEAPKSIAYRVEYWIATLAMLKEHWLFGVGLGNFQSYYPQFMLSSASETIADPHNWILDLAVTCSLPVALVVLWGLFQWLSSSMDPQEVKPNGCEDDLVRSSLTWGILLGGTCVCLGLGLIGSIDVLVVLISSAAAAVFTLLCAPLVTNLAQHQPNLLRAAPVAMLLCLLASGSWQAPGIVVPLIVLVASSTSPIPWNNTVRNQPISNYLPIAISVACLAAFSWQSWFPTSNSKRLSHAAMVAGNAAERLDLISQAFRADPLDTELQRFQCQLFVDRALASRDTEMFATNRDAAVEELDVWLRREPVRFLSWQFAGDRLLELADKALELGQSPTDLLEQAAQKYNRATEAFPSSVQLHVQLAVTYALLSQSDEAKREIATADALSQNTSHLDRKLELQLVWLPFRTAPTMGGEFDARILAALRSEVPSSAPGWVPAEPVAAWIRNQQ